MESKSELSVYKRRRRRILELADVSLAYPTVSSDERQTESGKLTPNLDENSTKVLNLTVLQRIDSFIEEILITASHVTFYEFDNDLNQWSRKDVEGALFVVKRYTQPRFQFIVMNRRNTDNLVESLLGEFEYEVQVPYLLYRNAAQEVNGIWFYNKYECEEVANLFSRILSAYSKVPPKPKSSSKSEFEELEAVPTTSVIDGPLEPSFNAPTSDDVRVYSSFLNFFSSSMNLGHNAPDVVNTGQPYHTSTALLSSLIPSAAPSHVPALQVPSFPLFSSNPPVAIHGTPDPINVSNCVINLVKPSSFFNPPSSSSPLITLPISSSLPTSASHPPFNLQHPYGTPALQSYPTPAPGPSVTPSFSTAPYYGPVDREKVHDALQILVQDDQFINLIYQALLKVHES